MQGSQKVETGKIGKCQNIHSILDIEKVFLHYRQKPFTHLSIFWYSAVQLEMAFFVLFILVLHLFGGGGEIYENRVKRQDLSCQAKKSFLHIRIWGFKFYEVYLSDKLSDKLFYISHHYVQHFHACLVKLQPTSYL